MKTFATITHVPQTYAGRPIHSFWAAVLANQRITELETVFDAIPLAIVVEDEERRIHRVNRVFESMFGYQKDQWLGQVSSILYAEERDFQRNGVLRFDKNAGSNLPPYSMRYRRSDDSLFWGETVGTIIRDKEGNHVGNLKLIRDITDQVQSREDLDHSQRELSDSRNELTQYATNLERVNMELEQFAYVASHDLKQPLRGINTLAQWVIEERANTLTADSEGHLKKLQERVRRLEKLLDDLLAYSRVDQHGIVPEVVTLPELLTEIGELLDPTGSYTVDYCGNVNTVRIERPALELVMRNLIGNSIKHHDQERGKITVTARLDDETATDETAATRAQPNPAAGRDLPHWIEFQVTDDGPGIEEAFLKRIFEMFQTLRPRDQVEGSGMGLTLIRKLVQSRGGNVSVRGHQGRGCTFFCRLPCEIIPPLRESV